MTEDLLALVAQRSGMVFAPNRRVEGEAGIARGMRRSGAADLADYYARVRDDAAALDDLVDELRVGETHFMRDPDQMALVRLVLAPLKGRGAARPPPRVWSAGCATGEEAYSLAILLEEEGLDAGAVVLGTDLSAAALRKARAASYSPWSMRGVSASFHEDYFHVARGRHVLVDRIRSKVRFEQLNLVSEEDYAAKGASGMDLILCRNVLIYFGHQAAERIAARLFDSLVEGGALLTAGADPLLGDHAPFEVEVTRAGLVYRRPRSASVAPSPPSRPPQTRRAVDREAPPSAPAAAAPETDLGREAFLRVTRHANSKGAFQAERIAQAALRRHPLDAHLHYLRATLLLALDRDAEAEQAAGRALYLEPSLAVAHFLLGTLLRKRGARPGALRAFRNARDLCADRPADEAVPAGAGERTGALHSAASAEMARLEAALA